VGETVQAIRPILPYRGDAICLNGQHAPSKYVNSMRCRIRASVALLTPPYLRASANHVLAPSRLYSTKDSSEPLRILFCGSDEFSSASLRALHAEHRRNPQSIASIDVVHRPAKRVERGLKAVREGNSTPFPNLCMSLTITP
jgi:hypothetical protein